MKCKNFFLIKTILLLSYSLLGQNQSIDKYWEISSSQSIVWKLDKDHSYPHEDNIEMSGKKVSAIIYYKTNEHKEVEINREIIYPQLRTIEEGWKKYRAYHRLNYADEIEPTITMDRFNLIFNQIDSVKIDGKLTFYHTPVEGIILKRTLFPSMNERLFVENWELTNIGDKAKELKIGETNVSAKITGYKGKYTTHVYNDAMKQVTLNPKTSYNFTLYFSAAIDNEPINGFRFQQIEAERDAFISKVKENLVLETSDPVIDQLFYFSKIRASESIFESKMGLVHSPGGGNYYIGIWANDQVEYSGPFFPFLGYDTGIEAAKNAYLMFLKNIPEDFSPICYAFEIDGELPNCGKDRGDAAMIAYGASQFALRYADKDFAQKIWPLIEWCINYCHKKTNAEGVVLSETDEMEGRISTGEANLSTSSLYYGGLINASYLAKELGHDSLSALYSDRSIELSKNIEDYFGSELEGLNTYRYFKGNTHLRHWICLPLVMGIENRAETTATALLDKLWTSNGVLVELNPNINEPKVFWDRGTLYALRGTFKAGFFDQSLEKLEEYSNKRLLGDHVPYAVEAYPENNMKHLSAESALYCRLIIEGILSFEQTGFNSFSIEPQLSDKLPRLSIKNLHLGDNSISINLEQIDNNIKSSISLNGIKIIDRNIRSGEKIEVSFL
ncbi:six-hairpin glycosidase-like protein [Zunongwangia sp. HGR-M22]|uniref:six-hairpin glycosidase-like protein n=1 Tax=Zunongwangia sp. HGR-M22 TaxID=3015168 RepID=UPI0022DD99D8|nr:six-hairpin glycosidase-like protein [Zunongwangia sp. HGR-M22]WBL24215.1 six-hairpin glycosidase-like protein [Zunongwangia sp. HGR-M22]